MDITKILSREHSVTRFEIYQTEYSLWLRCYVCDLWVTDVEFNDGWIEIAGCQCEEHRLKVDDMSKGAGILSARYGSSADDQYLQFIKSLTASDFPLDDLLNGEDVEDVPLLYQWIAFWTGNDVLKLDLDFSVPR